MEQVLGKRGNTLDRVLKKEVRIIFSEIKDALLLLILTKIQTI